MSLLMASRIHGDVYVRFRGRYAETCRRKAVRRCIPSLQTNLQEARPDLYKKLADEGKQIRPQSEGEDFSFAPIDRMIRITNGYAPSSLPTETMPTTAFQRMRL